MFKKLRNRKYIKEIRKIEVVLAIVQGRIDFYEADLRLNWDDPERAMYSGMMLGKYWNMKMELISTLQEISSKLK